MSSISVSQVRLHSLVYFPLLCQIQIIKQIFHVLSVSDVGKIRGIYLNTDTLERFYLNTDTLERFNLNTDTLERFYLNTDTLRRFYLNADTLEIFY